jgi:hypothetical protein
MYTGLQVSQLSAIRLDGLLFHLFHSMGKSSRFHVALSPGFHPYMLHAPDPPGLMMLASSRQARSKSTAQL